MRDLKRAFKYKEGLVGFRGALEKPSCGKGGDIHIEIAVINEHGDEKQREHQRPFHTSMIHQLYKNARPFLKILRRSVFVLSGVFVALFLFVAFVRAGPPPMHVDDPAIQIDFEDIYNQLATHTHDGAGSVEISTGGTAALEGTTVSSMTINNLTVSTLTVTTHMLLQPTIGTSTPTANTLYADLMPRAIGQINLAGTVDYAINVTSVTHPGTGVYRVHFMRDFSSANYVCVSNRSGSANNGESTVESNNANWSAHTAVFRISLSDGSSDNGTFFFACFGAQ